MLTLGVAGAALVLAGAYYGAVAIEPWSTGNIYEPTSLFDGWPTLIALSCLAGAAGCLAVAVRLRRRR